MAPKTLSSRTLKRRDLFEGGARRAWLHRSDRGEVGMWRGWLMWTRGSVAALAAVIALVGPFGCAPVATPPPEPAGSPAPSRDEPTSPLGSPFRDEALGHVDVPLVIDRTDLRIGTTVQYRRLPSPNELHDLTLLPGLARIVLSFDSWPREYASLEALNRAPQGVEIMVVISGWPPSRSAIDIWNYVSVPLRIVVIVPDAPSTAGDVANLNELRALERVIAEMDEPSRSGFERLQRPLSFRKIIP
jgi:hypothetical protein